jgi:hypothetical protein
MAATTYIPEDPSYWASAPAFEPGTHFQNYVLENYFCPVVRPLNPSLPAHKIWVSQTNGDTPCDNRLVAKALNFHFCGYPERFIVNPDIPFVFSSSVAANVIKLHLIRIGVFALEGFIFHIHGDRQSAISNVSCMAASLGEGKDSKFQPMEALLAQQQPAQPIYFPDRKHGEQLDGSNVDMPAC